MKASKKESGLAFIALTILGVFLLGRKIFDPARLLFEAVRDPNPWLVSYPWRAFTRLSFFSGEFPVWNPYNGLGEPFLANFQSAVFSVLRWPYYFLPVRVSSSPMILFQLVFAGFGAWLFAKKLKLSSASSFLCAVGFMLSGYLVQYMNNQHIVIDLLIPYGLLAAESAHEKPTFRSMALLVLVFTLVLLGGQPGAEIFTIAFIALYFLFKTAGRLRPQPVVILCVAFAIALITSSIQILPFLEAIPQSWTYHPPGYAFQHLEIGTLPSVISQALPIFTNEIMIQQTFPWLGEIVLLLALVALFCLPKLRREAVFFGLLGILGMGVIYGVPVFRMAAHIPGVSRLSIVKYAQPMITFCFVILAGFGFEKIFIQKEKTPFSAVLGPVVFLVLVIIGMLSPEYFYGTFDEGEGEGFSFLPFGESLLIKWYAAMFALYSTAIFLAAMWNEFSKRLLKYILIGLAIAAPITWHHLMDKPDFWENMELVNLDNFKKLGEKNGYARFAAEPKVWIPNQMLTLPLYDAGIADAVTPKRYVKLVNHLNGYKNEDELLTDFFAFESLRLREKAFTDPLSRLLSVAAFVSKEAPAQGGEGYWLDEKKTSKKYSLTALFGDPVYVTPLKNYLPRVFFPRTLVFCRDGDESFNCLLKIENLEEQAVAFVTEIQPANLPVFVQPESKTLKLGLNRVDLSYRSSGAAFAVFSEQYYPGWRAYLDGAEIKIHPADYLLRGVFLPSGEHRVEMVYQPWGFRVGLYSTLSSLLAVVIFISGSSAGRARRAPVPEAS